VSTLTTPGKAVYFAFVFSAYIIPLCFVMYAAITIAYQVKRHQRKNNKKSVVQQHQFKIARIFINIIVGFLVPYFLVSLQTGIQSIVELNLSFETDFITRQISSLLVFSNCVMNPVIYYIRSQNFREKVDQCFTRKVKKGCRNNSINPSNAQPAVIRLRRMAISV
jgi:uncharacterized membrane protein